MEKMKMETPNLTDQNIEKIAELFPNCITETKIGGGYQKAINFDLLKQMLSDSIVEGKEVYEFTWPGKKEAIIEANTPIRKTLRPYKEESKNWDTTENLYIEGENLEALKLLQESYLGKVKMIYIDPPYNTGNDFIYNDNFRAGKDEYETKIGNKNEDGIRMIKNTESNGRFHSDWCSMIYPRLLLAKSLLSRDGIILISIDDNEYSHLKEICDEIFGESNCIATFVVSSNSSKNNAKLVSVSHEYILCYSKMKEAIDATWKVRKNGVDEFMRRAQQLLDRGLSSDEVHAELMELVKRPRFYDLDHYTYADNGGIYQTDNPGGITNGNNTTEIIHPITNKPCCKPAGGWRYKEEEIKRKLKNNEFEFGADETTIPRPKRYLKDFIFSIPKSVVFFDSQGSTKWLKAENIPFDFPKAIELIKWLISMIQDNDCIIMDFFSGSATTAHATIQQNVEDSGNRRFILVQFPELTDKNSLAYKKGFKNICEIGKERIRRAGEKIKAEHPEAENLDIGFRVLKVDSSNMNDVYYAPDDYSQGLLDHFESNIKEDRSSLDLLFGCLLDWGLPLSLPYTSEEIDGFTVHNYNDGDLIACFDENISDSVIKEIAKRQPLRAVFRDSSFESNPSKINVSEIFKMISPDTTVKVI